MEYLACHGFLCYSIFHSGGLFIHVFCVMHLIQPFFRSTIGRMVLAALALGSVSTFFIFHDAADAAVNCPLTTGAAYKTNTSPSVYYISSDCKKRPILNPEVFFSHFSSWRDVQIVSASTLNTIPNHAFNFLPWGQRRALLNGSLVKTLDDSRTYMFVRGTLHPIESESVFTGFGFSWSWVDDVAPEVIAKYPIGASVTSVNTPPVGFVFKYSDSPTVYVLWTENGVLVKQRITSMEQLRAYYRADRIAVLSSSVTFPDIVSPRLPLPPIAPGPAQGGSGNPTVSSTPNTSSTPSVPSVPNTSSTPVTSTPSNPSNPTPTTTPPTTTPPTTTPPTTTPPTTTPNVAPSVSLTSPVNNALLTSGTSVTLNATASDSDGSITSVEFLNGTTVLGTDNTSPYSYTWTNIPVGTHTLIARATDNAGAVSVSSQISVTVTAPQNNNGGSSPGPSTNPSGSVNTANANSGMGTNVTQFREWASEFTFKDAFRRARAWSCAVGPCTYDANGWPTSGRVSTVLFTGGANFLDGKYPSGQYVVLYEGTGAISYGGSAVKNTSASRAGRDIIDVNSSSGSLTLTVNGSVRNIRVIMPGGDCGDIFTFAASASDCPAGTTFRSNEETYTTQPFHSLYLQRNKNYKSIRFTWWMLPEPYVQSTRLTAATSWSQRPKMTDAIWTGRGVPVEAMVQLANTLNVDPWFNIPHLSNDLLSDNPSDPYVAQFATYVRDHLNSNLKAYIEYSNEVWNGGPGGYEQAEHARERGLALGLGTAANSYLAQLRFQSQQSVRMFRIWDQVYGGHSSRVVRVLAARSDGFATIANIETDLCGRTGNLNYPWSSAQLLAWQSAYRDADAISIAPYFNVLPSDESRIGNGTLDQLFSYINDTLIPVNTQQIQANAALARDCGKELVAYEGGNHLVERGTNVTNAHETALYNDANRDPRMGTVYTRLFTVWKESGGHLFEHFVNTMQQSAGGVGRFGALESLLQSSSPKYDAIMNFIRNNPKWW